MGSLPRGCATLWPGLVVFADYNYGQRHQGSFNFATGNVAVGAGRGEYNDATSQGFLLGMVVKSVRRLPTQA